MARVLFLLAGIVGVPMRSAVGQADCYYTWTQIPSVANRNCYAEAINNLGQVVGNARNAGDYERAFIWSPERGTQLLPLPAGVYDQEAYDINDHGQVVGSMNVASMAYVWDGEEYTYLQPPAWANWCQPAAINNSGQVAGTFGNYVTGPMRAFQWHDGRFVDLGAALEVDTQVTDINELGEIIGYGSFPADVFRAFRIVGGVVDWLPEPTGFVQTFARSLNNNGLIVGGARVTPSGASRGLIWSADTVQVIEPPPDRLWSGLSHVNDAGQALGSYSDGGGINSIVFIWQADGISAVIPLITPPISGFLGGPLNDFGQIAGRVLGGTTILDRHWLVGDLNVDCHVDLDDLLLLLSNFGQPQGSFPRGDVDHDGDVDLLDLATLLSHWGT